jgi:hypothetical protein
MTVRLPLFAFVFVAACSKGPNADLQYIKQARSLAAEWALVNEQAGEGKLTATYVSSMHEALQEQLRSSAAALTEPNSDYAREMQALLQEPADAEPVKLRAHSSNLKRIEDALESA